MEASVEDEKSDFESSPVSLQDKLILAISKGLCSTILKAWFWRLWSCRSNRLIISFPSTLGLVGIDYLHTLL